MSKRKAVDLEFDYLKKKKIEIDKKMSGLQKVRKSCVEADTEWSSEGDVTPEYRPSGDESEEAEKSKYEIERN